MAFSCGVVHAEQPSASLQRAGGTMHGVQLWINLPARDKALRCGPAGGRRHGARARGQRFRRRLALAMQHPVDYYRIALAPQASLDVAVSPTATVLAYPIAGTMHAGARAIERGELANFRPGADSARLQNCGAGELDVLVLARPLRHVDAPRNRGNARGLSKRSFRDDSRTLTRDVMSP